MRRNLRDWLLIILLLCAACLRFYRLDEIPPGVTHDEADTGYFVAAVYRGAPSQVKAPYGYAYEPFTQYSAAPFMALFGPNDFALRVHSAFFGLILLLFTYLWGRRAFGAAVGLGGAALIGLSFWTVCDSRFALNSQPVQALFTGATYFLWRALSGGRRTMWGGFVLCLSGSLYVYEAARVAAAAFACFWLYLACFDQARFRQHGAWFAGALLLTGLLAAPHLLDPGAWGRTQTLSGPLRAAAQGDWRPLWANVLSTLRTFSFSGDSFITYNLPGRPIFDPLVSLFFYGGIALCLWRWRRPAYAFVLMWLAAGLLPSLVLGEWTSTLHSKVAEAPIMTLPALCAVEVRRWLVARYGRRWGRLFAVACMTWLPVVAASTAYDYFIRWGESPATRAAYFHNLVAAADYLEDTSYSGVVTFSSPFPDLPLDPFIAEMRLHRADLSLRWCDARRALVFPAAPRALLVLPPNTPLDPRLGARLDLRLVERVPLRPDDVDPYFDVFEWSPQAGLARLLAAGQRTPSLPANFGGAVELMTCEILPAPTLELLTVWRVLDPAALGPPPPHDYGHALVIFFHALDADGRIIGQEDRLDAPAWNWHAGDAFAQLHRLPVAERPARLAVGVYRRADLTRLPVLVDASLGDGVEAGDHVVLEMTTP